MLTIPGHKGKANQNHINIPPHKPRRPKIACSPSYAGYKLKTNAVILLDVDHTRGKPCIGQIGQGMKTKNMNMVNVLTV
jgi:hypothetical protein